MGEMSEKDKEEARRAAARLAGVAAGKPYAGTYVLRAMRADIEAVLRRLSALEGGKDAEAEPKRLTDEEWLDRLAPKFAGRK